MGCDKVVYVWVCVKLLYVKFVCVKLWYVTCSGSYCMWEMVCDKVVCVCECVWSYCMLSLCVWSFMVCDMCGGGGRRREEEEETRDTGSKTRTPHKVVGNKHIKFWSSHSATSFPCCPRVLAELRTSEFAPRPQDSSHTMFPSANVGMWPGIQRNKRLPFLQSARRDANKIMRPRHETVSTK